MKIRITKNHVDALCVLIGVLGMGSLYFQVLRMPLMAAMMKQSKKTYFLVDGDKLTGDPKSGIYFFCDFSSCTGVISDYAFSPEVKAAFPDTEFIEV